jgi:hypothetical protein
MKGWIYALTNKSIPGLVKIGSSLKDPQLLIVELDKAGLPTPYELEIEFLVYDLEKTLKTISEKMKANSTTNGWYKIDSEIAILTIGSCLSQAEQNSSQKYLEKALKNWKYISQYPDSKFRIKTLIDPQMPLEVFEEAIEQEKDSEVLIKALAAKITKLSDEKIISILAKHQDKSDVTVFIASQESTSLEVLKFILQQPDWSNGVPTINFSAWKDTNLSQIIFRNPKIDSETLHTIVTSDPTDFDWKYLGEIICSHPNCKFETLAHCCYFFDLRDEELNAITTNKEWDLKKFQDYLYDLVKSGNSDIAEGVASHQLCPAELLIQLSSTDENSDEEVVRVALENPRNPIYIAKNSTNLSTDIFYLLLFDSKLVKKEIAANINCSEKILRELSIDLDSEVRLAVALNEATSIDVLISLSKDKNENVRKAVASNENCPQFLLEYFCIDTSPLVRLSVSENTNAGPEVLLKMSNETDHDVIENLYSRRDAPPDLLRTLSVNNFFSDLLSKNPNTPDEILERIASEGSELDRITIAKRLDCPLTIMPSLALDPSPKVREAILDNKNCSHDTFLVFANSPIYEWRAWAASSLNCPVSILTELSKDNEETVAKLAKRTLKKIII